MNLNFKFLPAHVRLVGYKILVPVGLQFQHLLGEFIQDTQSACIVVQS